MVLNRMSISELPDEILCSIVRYLTPNYDDDQQTYDDIRNVRLAGRRLDVVGVRFLFPRLIFSSDPSTWARALAISKRPLLAQNVHTIVYSATYYDPESRRFEEYANHINNKLIPPHPRSLHESISSSGLECYSDEALRRGYQLYSFKLGMQSQISSQLDNFESASDFKMFMRVMRRLPNVRNFIIDRPSFIAPTTVVGKVPEHDTGPRYFAPTSATRYGFRWKTHFSDDPDRTAVELLPADDVPRNLLHLRWSLIETEMLWLLNERTSDLRSRLKFRALRMMDRASRLLNLVVDRADIVLDEGLTHVVRSRERVEIPTLPSCSSLLSSLRTLRLSLLVTLNQEAEFLCHGHLARFVTQSPHLTELCITVVYNIGAIGAKRINAWDVVPSCGWFVPLIRIFGDEPIPCLRSLSIDGLISSREDLLTLLARHKSTLRILKISGLAAYLPARESQDFLTELREGGRFEDCAPALNAMSTLELRLEKLVVRARNTECTKRNLDVSKRRLRQGPIIDVHDLQDLEQHRFDDVVVQFRGEALISELFSTFTQIEPYEY